MPTLIGRFNELLHNLSSSSSNSHPSVQTTTTTTTRQHHHPPSRSSSNRIVSTGVVKRSSSSRPQQQYNNKPTTTVNSTNHHQHHHHHHHNRRHGSLVTGNNNNKSFEKDQNHMMIITGNRHRASSCINNRHQYQQQQQQPKQQQQQHLSQQHSLSKTTTKPKSSSRESNSNSNGASSSSNSQNNHSSITMITNNNRKDSNRMEKNNNNNCCDKSCASKPPLIINSINNNNHDVDESLTSMLVRKMKIGAITRRNHHHHNGNNQQTTEIFHKKISKITKKDVEESYDLTDGETKGCFINRYLDGHLIKNHPDIISGKTCYDMPVKEIELLETNIVAAFTGPNDGLRTINSSTKPFDVPLDDGIDFIDEDYPDSSLSSNGACSDHNNHSSPQNSAKLSTTSSMLSSTGDVMTFSDQSDQRNKSSPSSTATTTTTTTNNHETITIEPVAGVNNWNRFDDFAYGISTTLYESHPTTKQRAGDPIADSFAICVRENSAILALADGVNWGDKACLASRCAIHGCIDYLNKALYSAATDSTRSRNTMDIFIALLRSFNAAHNMILAKGGHLTTLCAAVICQLKDSDRFIVCTCNVGDSLAYVYSQKYGVREITQGSHDIFSMRDMRDALGALGPVSGSEPELNNLTVAMTIVDVDDIVFLTSDGISDNFDPVVGKFAIPKKDLQKNCDPMTMMMMMMNDDNHMNNNNNNNNLLLADKSRQMKNNNNNNESNCEKTTKLRKIVQRSNSNPEKSSARYLNYTSKGLPLVSAQQRHELTLLRMEDLIMNGVNGISSFNNNNNNNNDDGDVRHEHSSNHDYNKNNNNNQINAKDLCLLMVDFSTKLTMAKRRILEDPELYSDDDNGNNGNGNNNNNNNNDNDDDDDVFDKQRRRRRMVGQKLAQLPGKLDHASIAAIQVGFYGSLQNNNKKSHIYSTNNNNNNVKTMNREFNTNKRHSMEDRYNLKLKATLARFESQDSLESINEAGPI
ncbi:hypothetical protein DERF_008573 [Dermatophagoides farinae]|uniref:PPM-type phosphatase domain-containing protein n=1 Tax=Dermatophagoides farinae TaxID=6954 RepID=A0A922L4W8_DERFA|nr:hypothetical protein DERF_008573 [Dermatophagoides farinae]